MSGGDDRIIDSPRGQPVAALRAMTFGALAALVFGSTPLLGWSRGLPDGPVAQVVQAAAEEWDGAMRRAGAAWPYRSLRALIRAIEAGRG